MDDMLVAGSALLEEERVNKIRDGIKDSYSEIIRILDSQSMSEHEIGGRVVEGSGIKMEIMERENGDILHGLVKYMNAYRPLPEILVSWLKDYAQRHRSSHSNVIDYVVILERKVENCCKDWQGSTLYDRKYCVDNLEYLINNTYDISFQRLGVTEPDFLGMFHVHRDGSGPSEFDLMNNSDNHIPILTIAPKYRTVSSYLVHNGESELVHDGIIPSEFRSL
jgi:hypothetical protein